MNIVTTPLVVIRPMAVFAMNHRLPSGPVMIAPGRVSAPRAKRVTAPVGVMRAISLVFWSVNHMLPSGPAVMSSGLLSAGMPSVNVVMTPAVVIRPILGTGDLWMNQRSSCVPAAIEDVRSPIVRPSPNIVTCPDGVVRPMPVTSVNQTLPSGPSAVSPTRPTGV